MKPNDKPTPAGLALAPLAGNLRLCFRYDPPRGERDGRTRVSRMIERFYECSSQRARQIVRKLERHGYMYSSRKGRGVQWHFAPVPSRPAPHR